MFDLTTEPFRFLASQYKGICYGIRAAAMTMGWTRERIGKTTAASPNAAISLAYSVS